MRFTSQLRLGAVAVLVAIFIAPAVAGAEQPERASVCQGVSILSVPLVAIGIGPLVTSLTGPLDDTVVCQLLTARRRTSADAPAGAAAGGHCKNAQKAGYRLRAGAAAKAVRCLINAERTSRGLKALNPRDSLREAAREHTAEMIRQACFSHKCPGERELIGRVTSAGYLPCNCAWSVGEDLAFGVRRYSAPQEIVKAWMGSPPHRANILSPPFEEVDVGVATGRPGKPGGKAATYTADFGFKN